MPRAGSYWYGREGRPSVVRVLAGSEQFCTHLQLNAARSLPYYQRIRPMQLALFLEEYQSSPDVSDEWIAFGTQWYHRDDADQVLAVTSVERSREPRAPDRRAMTVVGSLLAFERQYGITVTRSLGERTYTVNELTTRYIRIDTTSPASLTRFWAIGEGIYAPFSEEFEARAFAYHTATALGLSGSIRVYQRPLDYRPPVVNEAEPQLPPRRDESIPRDVIERSIAGILSAMPGATLITPEREGATFTVTSGPLEPPSLWDHLTKDEDPP